MSDGIDIPFSISGADAAKIALDAIVASFTGLEREVIKVAEKSDTAKAAFGELKQKFADGKITADDMRASLAKIAEQAPRVGTSLKGAMDDGARGASGLRDALTNVKDAGLHELSQKAGELGQRIGGVTGQIAQVAIRSLAAFGPVGVALTGVGAAVAFATQAYEQHRAAIELADAKVDALTESERNLGASYPSVAEAVRGATTAVEAHTRAIAEQQRLLGQQIALMGQAFSGGEARQFVQQIQEVSGAAQELGTFLRGASEEQIRSTIETGNATQQMDLLGLSFAHSSNAVEEHQRRLDAIIVLQHRAAEAVASHKDEILAQARAELTEATAAQQALQNGAASSRTHEAEAAAARRVQEAAEALAVAQNRAAEAHRNAAAGALDATRALDSLDAAQRSTEEAARDSALQRGQAAINRVAAAHPYLNRNATADAEMSLKANISRRMAIDSHGGQPGKSAKAGELAADRAMTDAYTAEREALERLRETEAREADARDALHRTELDRLTERLHAEQERAKAESPEGARARMAQQRAEGGVAARAEAADLRDPASQRERLEEMRQQRALQRERSHLERRYQMQRSFVERMEDLHDREISGTEELAEATNMAMRTTGEALAAHLQSFADGRETAAEALQNMLADTLKSIGKEALIKSGFFFAEGLGNLAMFNFPGAATAFAASAAYAVVGGGLVAGGNALTDTNTLGQRKDAADKAHGGAGTRESAARLPKGGASGGEGGTVYNVTFGGPMYGTGGVRQAARQMVGAINRGAIQGGVQLLPGTLMGGGAGS